MPTLVFVPAATSLFGLRSLFVVLAVGRRRIGSRFIVAVVKRD
jgi:hypothetical protein